jgi:hypothetical protein
MYDRVVYKLLVVWLRKDSALDIVILINLIYNKADVVASCWSQAWTAGSVESIIESIALIVAGFVASTLCGRRVLYGLRSFVLYELISLADAWAFDVLLDAFGAPWCAFVTLYPSLRTLATAVISHRWTLALRPAKEKKNIHCSTLQFTGIRNKSERGSWKCKIEVYDKHGANADTRVRVWYENDEQMYTFYARL